MPDLRSGDPAQPRRDRPAPREAPREERRAASDPPHRCPSCGREQTRRSIFESRLTPEEWAKRKTGAVGVIRGLAPGRWLLGCRACDHTWIWPE